MGIVVEKTSYQPTDPTFPKLMFDSSTDKIYLMTSDTKGITMSDDNIGGHFNVFDETLFDYHGTLTLKNE